MSEYVYDRVPYPALSYTPTHPDRLAIMARLMGMRPAPVGQCRVLELGCAVGGNLIPMAYGLPGSLFLGIDNSARQVAEAQEAAAALGLENVAFQHLDIMDVTAKLGEFDYIIAHGVYSWVPDAVRYKILEICRENLAPDGVAYISYNTYPGWHMVRIVRDMLLYHTRHTADPMERADQARAVLGFFAQGAAAGKTVGDEADAYSSFLSMYAGVVGDKLDGTSSRHATLVLHDEMADINEPFYFYQFAEQVARHGLQYLGEADFSGMRGRMHTGGDVPPQVTEGLQQLAGDLVELEQAVDFLHNRMFRRSLLCHGHVVLPERVVTDVVSELYATSRARPAGPDPDLLSVSPVRFQSGDGPAITTDHPVSKMALYTLAEQWPAPVRCDDLLRVARARWQAAGCSAASISRAAAAGGDEAVDAEALTANLLTAYSYSNSLVDFHSYRPAYVPEVSERPVASAVARYQIQRGNLVTNLRHERVTLDNLDGFVLYHLDGSRDRAGLLDLLMAGPVAQGVLTVQRQDEAEGRGYSAEGSLSDAEIRGMLAAELERKLDWLACAALLVG
ncbi:MAG: methyltransferase regulatory domain-containing protein [Anaerolineae bacterium]|nr:methyltransferase regulatory domain-containing protein [Anaerolineae bacterium]